MKKIVGNLLLFLFIALPFRAIGDNIPLVTGWKVQVGNNLYNASLPATAIDILLKNRVYNANILRGVNYKQIDKTNLSRPWLFRNRFVLKDFQPGKHAFLNLDGVNYSANVLVNGKLVASRKTLKGLTNHCRIDITEWADEENELTIQVFPPQEGDPNYALTAYNPGAADSNMGLLGNVSVDYVDDVAVNSLSVATKVDTKTWQEAWVTIHTSLQNLSDHVVTGALVGKLGVDYLYYAVTLKPGENRNVVLTSAQLPKLDVKNPRLWWIKNLGNQEMYDLSLEFDIETKVSDKRNLSFGIRDLKTYMTADGHTGLMLNGKKIQVRGSDWTNNIFMQNLPDKNESLIAEANEMNLNLIRFHNLSSGSEGLLTLCDKNGIIAVPMYTDFNANHEIPGISIHNASLLSQHPSLFSLEKDVALSPLVKAAPAYQLPIKETIVAMLDSANVWPVNNDYYTYHCAISPKSSSSMEPLNKEINAKFGSATDFADFSKKADWLNYEAYRSAYEYPRIHENAGGVITGMLAASWPSFCEQFIDAYNNPTSSFYAVKTANAERQLISDGKDVYVVNSGDKSKTMKAFMNLFNLDSKTLQQASDTSLVVAPHTVKKIFTLNSTKDDAVLLLSLQGKDKFDVYSANNAYFMPAQTTLAYQNLSAIAPSTLEITVKPTQRILNIEVKNTSDKVSFFNRLCLKMNGYVYDNVTWSDNYFTLKPGEVRKITCQSKKSILQGSVLTVSGWNTKDQTIDVNPGK